MKQRKSDGSDTPQAPAPATPENGNGTPRSVQMTDDELSQARAMEAVVVKAKIELANAVLNYLGSQDRMRSLAKAVVDKGGAYENLVLEIASAHGISLDPAKGRWELKAETGEFVRVG